MWSSVFPSFLPLFLLFILIGKKHFKCQVKGIWWWINQYNYIIVILYSLGYMSTMANTSHWLKLTKVCFAFQIGLSRCSDPCRHSGTQGPRLGSSHHFNHCQLLCQREESSRGTRIDNKCFNPDMTHLEGPLKIRRNVDGPHTNSSFILSNCHSTRLGKDRECLFKWNDFQGFWFLLDLPCFVLGWNK